MQSFYQPRLEKDASDPLRREVAVGRTFYVAQAEGILDRAYLSEREAVKAAIIRQPEQIAEAVQSHMYVGVPVTPAAPVIAEAESEILNVEEARRNVDYIRYLTEEGGESYGPTS